MPRGKAIPPEKRREIYTRYTLGESCEDIAESMGITAAGARRIVREERKKVDSDMAKTESVIAGDKKHCRLIATSTDGRRYEGTHVTADGQPHRWKFAAINARMAEKQWLKWCEDLDSEVAFMDMVERRPMEDAPAADDPVAPPVDVEADPVDVEPAPVPEIDVRPWKDVAEERRVRIEELEARVAELEGQLADGKTLDHVIADTELAEPKLGSWFNDNGSFRVTWTSKPTYVLWAKTGEPRLYGAYHTMERALKELDRLNDVAAFLGSGGVFEVEEVAWR